MESCVSYVVSQSNTEVSDDLGYRWESGELSDWEVLAELTGIRVKILKNILADMDFDQWDAHDSWRRAGDAFDELLGPPLGVFIPYEGLPPFGEVAVPV
jgi:hypothetical protein